MSDQTAKGSPLDPPIRPDQEWANALTHGVATAAAVIAGGYLIVLAGSQTTGLVIACGVYVASVLATFACSTMSHVIRTQPLLNTLRAWDQAMIYAMIAGTYTPLVYRFAEGSTRTSLLAALWIAAGLGILTKVALRHRVNSSGTVSYLLLGYLPALPLASVVPSDIASWMVAGGVCYTIGVALLVNDGKVRYLHAAWHVSVMLASTIHFVGIVRVVSQTA